MPPPAKKPVADSPTLTAGDVKNATGMSYRQLNDWDSKGALPSQRQEESNWRKFTARQIFAIMVCKEIRDRFGTPLESLRGVREFLLQEGTDHLLAAIELMRFGFAVFIMTDLTETFVLEPDFEFETLLTYGILRTREDQGYVFIEVNHLVNRLLACLKTPVAALHIRDDNYRVLRSANTLIPQNEQEIALIRAIRQGDYQRVTLTKRNNENLVLEVEQELPEPEANTADINELLKEHEFQTVTVSRTNGKNVRVKRTLPVPLRRRHKQGN